VPFRLTSYFYRRRGGWRGSRWRSRRSGPSRTCGPGGPWNGGLVLHYRHGGSYLPNPWKIAVVRQLPRRLRRLALDAPRCRKRFWPDARHARAAVRQQLRRSHRMHRDGADTNNVLTCGLVFDVLVRLRGSVIRFVHTAEVTRAGALASSLARGASISTPVRMEACGPSVPAGTLRRQARMGAPCGEPGAGWRTFELDPFGAGWRGASRHHRRWGMNDCSRSAPLMLSSFDGPPSVRTATSAAGQGWASASPTSIPNRSSPT
jgi:hypothetical protein